MADEFELYTLEVSVEGNPKDFACSHQQGYNFSVIGENIIFNDKVNQFSLYALSALLPLLPVKQRKTDRFDWISTDNLIACPDPNCAAKFRIERKATTTFKHSEVTKVPLGDTE